MLGQGTGRSGTQEIGKQIDVMSTVGFAVERASQFANARIETQFVRSDRAWAWTGLSEHGV